MIKENEAQESVYVPMYEVAKTKTMKVAENIDELNENKYEELPVEKLADKLGFVWTDSMLVQANAKRVIQANKEKVNKLEIRNMLQESFTQLGKTLPPNFSVAEILKKFNWTEERLLEKLNVNLEKLKNFLNKSDHSKNLVIVKIDDVLGRVVMLAPKSSPIRKGEIVVHYAGKYIRTSGSFLTYGMDSLEHPVFGENKLNDKPKIDAQECGNESRFLPDLPTPGELEKYYIFRPNVKEKILLANLEFYACYFQNCPHSYFEAIDDIKSGILGFSYGTGYWARAEIEAGITRGFFYKDSRLVDEKDYVCKFYNIKISYDKQKIFYLPFEITDLKNCLLKNLPLKFLYKNDGQLYTFTTEHIVPALVFKFSKSTLEAKDLHKAKFSCSIKLIVTEFLVNNAFTTNEEVLQKISYVQRLESAMADIKDTEANKLYKALENIIKDKNCEKFYKEKLTTLRSEIIKTMTNYNNDIKTINAEQSADKQDFTKTTGF